MNHKNSKGLSRKNLERILKVEEIFNESKVASIRKKKKVKKAD